MLQLGIVLVEGGPDWYREIRMPEVSRPAAVLNTVVSQSPIPPLPADELSPAPRPELRPAANSCLSPGDGDNNQA